MATGVTPAIILVRPQLGENIGKVARAMANFGLSDLRLVAPRDGWPNPAAEAPASGANWILDTARVYQTTADAVADLTALYATTARNRYLIKPLLAPRGAAADMRAKIARGRKAGILFGAEATGLTNDELILADKIINIPTDPGFSSLNIAQAVLLMAYEWHLADADEPAEVLPMGGNRPATREELEGFFQHLEHELELSGFLRPEEKAPGMKRHIRNIFLRLDLLDLDVRTLRGIVKSLALYGRSKGKRRE